MSATRWQQITLFSLKNYILSLLSWKLKPTAVSWPLPQWMCASWRSQRQLEHLFNFPEFLPALTFKSTTSQFPMMEIEASIILLFPFQNLSVILFFFLFWGLGLGFELRALHVQGRHSLLEPHLQSILLWLFWRWGSCGWPRTVICSILASQVARITGISYKSLA
jgi:hypothetical protein